MINRTLVDGYKDAIRADHLADIPRMTDEFLDAYVEALDEVWNEDSDGWTQARQDAFLAHGMRAEREQDVRELWNHPDPRVREAQGNFR